MADSSALFDEVQFRIEWRWRAESTIQYDMVPFVEGLTTTLDIARMLAGRYHGHPVNVVILSMSKPSTTTGAFPPETRYRGSDPDTSREAAHSLPSAVVRASQEAVLELLRRIGPSTDVEIAVVYEQERTARSWPAQSPSGLRTRRSELVQLGLVADSGQRRQLPSGRNGIVWIVAR
jgi:hypothetical protein